MTLRSLVAAAACSLALLACSDAISSTPVPPAKLRIINSTFQQTDSTLASAQPRAIDVLIDSSTDSPGAANLAPNSITTGGSDASGTYRDLAVGLHTFTANLAAPATPATSFFSNGRSPAGPWLPKLVFTGATNYTLIIAGVAPAAGYPARDAFYNSSQTNFPLIDNLEPPPKVNGTYQSRFRLVNAAPFSPGGTTVGGTVLMFLHEGSTPPTAAQLAAAAAIGSPSATFRNQSSYVNVSAGQYVLTLASAVGTTRVVLAQPVVDLVAGEVRTFVIQNTAYASVPSRLNHTLTSIVDARY